MKKVDIILIVVLVASLLLNILFLSGVIQSSSDTKISYLGKECHDIGRDLHDDNLANAMEGQLYSRGEYTYNPELETCLYATGYTIYPPAESDAKIFTERMVIDSNTNQVILKERWTNAGALGKEYYVCDVCVSSSEEYERKKEELFN